MADEPMTFKNAALQDADVVDYLTAHPAFFERHEALLSPPMERPAYSDRMAYVLAEMSALAYYRFETKGLVNDLSEIAAARSLRTGTASAPTPGKPGDRHVSRHSG